MGFMNNLGTGFAVGMGVVIVVNIADGLSTYVFDGDTISNKALGLVGKQGESIF
jgi:hypothetical protein